MELTTLCSNHKPVENEVGKNTVVIDASGYALAVFELPTKVSGSTGEVGADVSLGTYHETTNRSQHSSDLRIDPV